MTTFTGYTESQERIKARWELMQQRAARKAANKQAPKVDRLLWALAIKRQMEGIR